MASGFAVYVRCTALQTSACNFCPFFAFFALNSSVEAVYSTSLPNSAAEGLHRRSGTTAVGANERRRFRVGHRGGSLAPMQPRRSPRAAHADSPPLALASTFRPPPPFPRTKKAAFFGLGAAQRAVQLRSRGWGSLASYFVHGPWCSVGHTPRSLSLKGHRAHHPGFLAVCSERAISERAIVESLLIVHLRAPPLVCRDRLRVVRLIMSLYRAKRLKCCALALRSSTAGRRCWVDAGVRAPSPPV